LPAERNSPSFRHKEMLLKFAWRGGWNFDEYF
jgi:hypothetical protein